MPTEEHPKNYYINPKRLYTELVKFYEARQRGEDPAISEYIGQCIILINQKIASRPNFSSYTFLQDMVADGILHCTAAVTKFNPNYPNAFGYFSTVAWRAFLQRIADEKKQNYTKHKNFQRLHLFEQISDTEFSGDVIDNEYNNLVIQDFEDRLVMIKQKGSAKGKK